MKSKLIASLIIAAACAVFNAAPAVALDAVAAQALVKKVVA